MASSRELPRIFFQSPTAAVARNLLGKVICRKMSNHLVLRAIIVEVEAYLHAGDAASHSARGETPSNRTMFGPAGRLYVYPIHAKFCANVVTMQRGLGAAVLIRSTEPLEGLHRMIANRNLPQTPERKSDWRSISTGPGRLCQAFSLSRSHDGIELDSGNSVWLEHSPHNISRFAIKTSKRIGITSSKDLPLRFFVDGNMFVSGLARDHSAKRNGRLIAADCSDYDT